MSDQNKGSSQSQPVSAPESAARNSSASMDMSKTTTPDLAALVVALREAAEKATSAEWVVSRGHYGFMNCFRAKDAEIGKAIAVEDAAYIALANPANVLALLDAYAEQGRKLEGLVEALQRIAAATPNRTNSEYADEAFSWVGAVANTALADPALKPITDQAATIAALTAEVETKTMLLRAFIDAHDQGPGLLDQMNLEGGRYTSLHLVNTIEATKLVLTTQGEG